MNIVKTPTEFIENFKLRGRPNKYPFDSLEPGYTLKIENASVDDIQRLRSALYQFKKNNKLNWKTSVRVLNNIIYVSRF